MLVVCDLKLNAYQNIRNNKNHARTPKWAQRYGLVDTTEIERKRKRSQWANRYNDRLPRSTLEGQDYEEGEVAGSNSRDDSVINGSSQNRPNEQYWNEEDERYYGANDSRSLDSGSAGGGRWHYPANFDDSVVALEADNGKKKKKVKKDRWARTEDAYSLPDDGSTKKKKKKKKKNHSTVGDSDSIDRRSNSTVDFPEDPEGGLYGDRYGGQRNENSNVPEPSVAIGGRQRDELDHEF